MIRSDDLIFVVQTLVNIFNSDLVVVCPEYDVETPWRDVNLMNNWRLVQSAMEGLRLFQCGQHGTSCLILCDDALPSISDLYGPSEVNTKDIVLLLPSTKVDLIANLSLRLGDAVLSYEEKDNLTTITEWYGLNGKKLYHKELFTKKFNEEKILNKVPYIWERRSDLGRETLAVSLVEKRPQVIFDHTFGRFDGLFVEVVRLLEERLNFKAGFVQPPDGVWGSQLPNGSWTGMVKQLMDKTVDMSLDLTWIPSRLEVIDYSDAVFSDMLTIILPKRENTRASVNVWVFMEIFPLIAWLAIALTVFITSLLFSKMIICESKGENFAQILCTQLISTSVNLIQLSFKDADTEKKRNNKKTIFSFRILFLISNVTFFLLYVVYTSDLTAYMTAGTTSIDISSFQDIIDLDYTLIYASGSMVESVLSNSKDTSPDMYTVYTKYSKGMEGSHADIHLSLNSNPDYVLYDGISMNMGYESLSRFQGAKRTQVGIGLQKGSDLADLLNYYILKLHKSGVMSKLVFKWQDLNKPDDYSDRMFVPDALAMGYDNLVFLALVLTTGILLSAMLAVLEFANNYCARRKLSSKTKKLLSGEKSSK